MGGLGSGRGSRRKAWRSKKKYISNLKGLTIPELMKLHRDNPNSTFTFCNMHLAVIESSILINNTYTIKLDAMPCNYGGFRYFGHCPACQKRVRTLYLYKTVLVCRHCLSTVYESQNATLSYRLLVKRDRVGKIINNDVWTKPKWMRKKTFARLRGEYFDLDEKEMIAHMFSLRNNQAVDSLFNRYGAAVCVGEAWETQMLKLW